MIKNTIFKYYKTKLLLKACFEELVKKITSLIKLSLINKSSNNL